MVEDRLVVMVLEELAVLDDEVDTTVLLVDCTDVVLVLLLTDEVDMVDELAIGELVVDELDDRTALVLVVVLTDELELEEIVTVEINDVVVDLYQ